MRICGAITVDALTSKMGCRFTGHLKRQEKKRRFIYFVVDYSARAHKSTLVCVCLVVVVVVVEVVKEEISEDSCECGSSHALFD